MRIIAKKRDYYDCIQSYAQDRSVLYVRNEQEEDRNLSEFRMLPQYTSVRKGTERIIGFCGKLYPLVEIHSDMWATPANTKYLCYSIDEVDAFMESNLSKGEIARYRGTEHMGKRTSSTYRQWANGYNRTTYLKWFDDINKVSGKLGHVFDEKRCPVFTITYNNWQHQIRFVYNALLNQYEFFRIFNPHDAYQNIFMFMSNMAVPQKKMPVISDEMKIASHGFTKYSFRNYPIIETKNVKK